MGYEAIFQYVYFKTLFKLFQNKFIFYKKKIFCKTARLGNVVAHYLFFVSYSSIKMRNANTNFSLKSFCTNILIELHFNNNVIIIIKLH